MLFPTKVSSYKEIEDILLLQKENLKQLISEPEKQSQGFLTVCHTQDLLQKMHELAPSIIVKDGNQLAGYALVMLNECKALVPELVPMFDNFNKLHWKGKPFNEYSYYAMGQVCVAKAYRGQGVFDMLYQQHKAVYQRQFDFIVTEISTSNARSLRSHDRVGFVVIDNYKDELDDWVVVLWDWS
jgi:ribosomal protein S18 acetylase RimI-like enzyme